MKVQIKKHHKTGRIGCNMEHGGVYFYNKRENNLGFRGEQMREGGDRMKGWPKE